MRKLLGMLALSAMIGGCGPREIFNAGLEIPAQGWEAGRAAAISLPVTDTLRANDLYLAVTNSNDYRWENLFLFTTIEFPNKIKIKDTIEVVLSDKRGQWLGSGWGSSYRNEFLFRENVRFPLVGTYTIHIDQAMRCEPTCTLQGIEKIELSVRQRQ